MSSVGETDMKKKLQLFKSNKGAGLVSVVIAVAFIAILGSILLTVSYTNYSMKQVNYKTKDAFYSAEQALDEINVGLQNVISQAVSDAYLEVLENYSAYDLDKKKDLMEAVYFSSIWDELGVTGSNHTQYDVDKLRTYLFETAWVGDLDTGYGALITSQNNQMITYSDSGVVLKDVEIYYRDSSGYVSIIHTDIRLVLPDLEFSTNTELPNVANYALIADEKLVTGTTGTNVISGQVYAGSMDALNSNDAVRSNVQVINNTSFVVKNDLYLQNTNFVSSDATEVWTDNLIVDSSSATIEGAIHLSNDTNITGNASQVTVRQMYNGYGNSLGDSSQSSAILVNGTNAILDVSDCDIVTIAGHAYIGTSNHNVGATGTGTNVGNDVMTGESITVKSNQLLYLVPAECIGVNIFSGNSAYNKNPLTAGEYQEIIGNPGTYKEVDDSIVVGKLGTSLAPYVKYSTSTGLPEVEKVFIPTNGETLVYYYLIFNDENTANSYFQAYYAENSEQILEYMDFYSNGIQMENPEMMLRLQLAGNTLKYDGATGTSTLQTNTLVNASDKLESSSEQYERIHNALCTKLVSSYVELNNVYTTDLSNDIVFDNIVNEASMATFINNHYSGVLAGGSQFYVFDDGLTSARAVLIDNDTTNETYEFTATPGSYMENVHLIIATGDVLVSSNFDGLILSNGTITIANNVSVSANNSNVKEALRLTTVEGGTTYSVIEFLRDGTDILTVDGSEERPESVQLADLVVYENWKKE